MSEVVTRVYEACNAFMGVQLKTYNEPSQMQLQQPVILVHSVLLAEMKLITYGYVNCV